MKEINERETTPDRNTLTAVFALAGTSWCQWRPGCLSQACHISPWQTAQNSARVGICLLSIVCLSPQPSSMLSAGLSTGCSCWRDAPLAKVSRLCTSRICCPVGIRTTLGTFQSLHDCSSVYNSLLAVISCLSLGWVSCFRLCPSAGNHDIWTTCRPRTLPLPASSLQRSVCLCSQPRVIFARVLSNLDLLMHGLLAVQHLRSWWCPSVLGPSGPWHRCPGHRAPRMLIDCSL